MPVLFCRTLNLVRRTPLMGEWRIIGLRRGERYSPLCFSANALHPSRLKDEPRQGFISVQFLNAKSLYLVIVFRWAMRGFFVIRFFRKSRYAHCPKKTRDNRLLRCHKLLPSGAKRHLSKSCRYRNRKIYFAIIRVPFFKRKAVVIVCFEMCR